MKHQFLFISVYLALRPPSRLAGHPILSGIWGGLITENSVHISELVGSTKGLSTGGVGVKY